MTDRSANAILWAGIAIAALAFARSAADVDQWQVAHARHLERLHEAHPDLGRLVVAFILARAGSLPA